MIRKTILALGFTFLTQTSSATTITYNFSGEIAGSVEAFGTGTDDVITGNRIVSINEIRQNSSNLNISFQLEADNFLDMTPDNWSFWTTSNPALGGFPIWLTSTSQANGALFNKTSASNGSGLTIYDANTLFGPAVFIMDQNDWQTIEYHDNGKIKTITDHLLTHQLQLNLEAITFEFFNGKEIATDFSTNLFSLISMQHDFSALTFDEEGTLIYRSGTTFYAESALASWSIDVEKDNVVVAEPTPLILFILGFFALCIVRLKQLKN